MLIVFGITCVSSYWYYLNRNLFLSNDHHLNFEDPSALKREYILNQLDILQDDYITYVSGTAKTKHLGDVSKNKIDIQAQYLETAKTKHLGEVTKNKIDIQAQLGTAKTKHLGEVTKSKTSIQAQYLPGHANVTNPPITSHTALKESVGYILPYSIWEEQTSGANNLWQLQIWAKQVGMSVVEPFARDSLFTMRAVIPNFSQALRFGDYFDKEEWDEKVVRAGGYPLVKWEEFVTNFPRDAIILYTVRSDDEITPLTIAFDENATVCSRGRIPRRDMLWIKKTFNVIKTVCYTCATNIPHPLSLRKFNSLIFYDHGLRPNQVTLITVNWVGIRTVRIHINPLSLFVEPLLKKIIFPPSKRVMTAYKAYVQQFIGDHKYVGIVFRTHHVMHYSPLNGSFADQSRYLLECSKNLSKVLDAVRGKWKIFLAYDMGMFGSKRYATRNPLASLQEQIFLDVFNGSLQINEREENLIKAANGTTDRGVIAQLEKVISTNADCIVLLGPVSTFVKSSSFLYISQHSTKKCIVSICADEVYDLGKVISSNTIPNEFIND